MKIMDPKRKNIIAGFSVSFVNLIQMKYKSNKIQPYVTGKGASTLMQANICEKIL